MRSHQFRRFLSVVLMIGIFILQFIPAKSVSAAVDQTAYYQDIGKKLEYWANKYNIPPVLLKSIAWMESGWKQYKLDPSGQPMLDQPLIGYDGIGIGIMQISSYKSDDTETINKLKNDIDYNIEMGCQALNQKWRAYPKIGDGDRNVLENWYFAVWGYNCWGSRNNPNFLTGKSAYQDAIFSLMGQKYNSAITFVPSATNFTKDLLPPVNPPYFASRWSTPVTKHLGDLAIDSNSLISSGGGTGAEAANGDYWYKYARWSSYYALGFYVTAYNSPAVLDKSILSQKILSAYANLLAEADALVLEQKDTSYATAAKYYWTVSQGPNLDAALSVQASNGQLNALSKLLTEADKLLLNGTDSSISSAIQDYGTVLQGSNPDVSLSEQAKTGLLKAYGKLLAQADKLLEGPGPSILSAVQDYIIVLQGTITDASLTDQAKTGLLKAYGKLLDEADKLSSEGTTSSKASAAKYYLTVLQGPVLDAGLTARAKIGSSLTGNSAPTPNPIPTPIPPQNPIPVPTPEPQPVILSIERLYGNRAEETAIKISQQGWPDNTSPIVLLARVDRFQDALAAAPLAKKLHAPLLLTAPDKLDDLVLKEINRLGAGGKVYVIGGEGAIKKTVTDALTKSGLTFERLFGKTAADTAAEIARKIGPSKQVILASSTSFPDALSASAPAAALGIPILLSEQRTLPDATKQVLKDFDVSETLIVGGKFALSSAFDSKGGPLESYGPLRLAGDTKYDTMLQIVKHFKLDPKAIVVATGENFPDGLSGGAFAALSGSPMILIPKGELGSETQTYLKSLCGKTTKTFILGGTGVISTTNEKILGSLLTPP